MSKVLRYPDINPVRLAPAGLVFPDKYGAVPFGKGLQIETVKPNQVKEQWYQKFNRDQPICIHYHRSRSGDGSELQNPTELYILDEKENLLKYVNATSGTTLPGITDEVTLEQLYTEQFIFNAEQYAELNGHDYIYLRLVLYYADADAPAGFVIKDYLSNPIWLSDKHEGCSLFEYNNETNNYDVLFEQLNPTFSLLVDSNGLFHEPGGEFTVYNDQEQQTVKLYGKSTNDYIFDIGGNAGMPEHMIDIIDDALNCDNLRIDGRRYRRKAKELEKTAGDKKHLQWRNATLQDDG